MAKPNQVRETASGPITTVRLQNITQSYGQSAALMAAVEVGAFTAISKGAGTYEVVAAALDIHPTNAERLMVMLCAAEEDWQPPQQCSRCRTLPGRRQSRLHGTVDYIHQASME